MAFIIAWGFLEMAFLGLENSNNISMIGQTREEKNVYFVEK